MSRPWITTVTAVVLGDHDAVIIREPQLQEARVAPTSITGLG